MLMNLMKTVKKLSFEEFLKELIKFFYASIFIKKFINYFV